MNKCKASAFKNLDLKKSNFLEKKMYPILDTRVEFKNGNTKGVNKKLKDSLIIFANIAKEDLDYCRKNFEYIVVYNYDKNKDNITQKKKEKENKQGVDEYYKEGIANKLYKFRNDKDDELILFGLDLMKDICVSNVHTYTVDEFIKYYSKNCSK